VEKAVQKEIYLLHASITQAQLKETQIQQVTMQVKSHLHSLEDQANRNRTEITKIYNEIRTKLSERESVLKKSISETLEKEQVAFNRKINQLQTHVDIIKELKENKDLINQE